MKEEGFSYVRSKFTYKRKSGDFIQQIWVILSHYNTQQSIHFSSAFHVTSPKYNRWLKQKGREKFSGYLVGCMDWNIPRWREPGDHATSLDFSAPDSRQVVLASWLRRCLSAGIPYLDGLSTWEGAADDLIRCRWDWNRAADCYLIAGRSDRAVAALQQGIQALAAQEFSYSEKSHPTLVAKKRRQAAERDTEVAAYRSRVQEIENSEQLRPADADKPRSSAEPLGC